MKRAYYYFLFRVFRFYKDKYKYDNGLALWYVICLSTLLIFLNLFSIYGFANTLGLVPMFENAYWAVPIMAVLALLNYYFFIRKEEFLDYGFTKNKKGTWGIVAYYIITLAIVITTSQFNRAKVFAERRANPFIEQVERPISVEEQVINWWNDRRDR